MDFDETNTNFHLSLRTTIYLKTKKFQDVGLHSLSVLSYNDPLQVSKSLKVPHQDTLAQQFLTYG